MENRKKAGGQDEDKKMVEDVYREYTKRRMAIVKALTTDFQDFYRQCDPDKRENLCLYGLPNGEWEVNEPGEEVPPKLPEPILGINVARDALEKKDWICQVAIHSDSWLIAIASFLGAKFRFDKYDRKHLFALMNEFPTVYEVVRGKAEPNPTGKSKDASGSKEKQKNSEDAECGACRGSYEDDEFWICCDICERWFHGECVKITPSTAETIEQYKCPTCSRHRPN